MKLSPDAYHLWATDFWQAAKDFRRPPRFSPVPHFLACRAIELEIKSRLLRAPTVDVTTVKNKFKHDIFRAYKALDPKQQTLSKEEEAVLRKAEECYRTSTKYFEYWTPGNALTGFSKFPGLDQLYSIAAKLVEGQS